VKGSREGARAEQLCDIQLHIVHIVDPDMSVDLTVQAQPMASELIAESEINYQKFYKLH
jgi:hypothetical protein